MTAPGVATQDAFYGHVRTPKNPPFLYGFYGVMGTGGLVATLVHSQKRGNQKLIGSNRKNQQLFEESGKHGAKIIISCQIEVKARRTSC